MTWFWSTSLNSNESDDTFALVERAQKKKNPPWYLLGSVSVFSPFIHH